MRGQHGNLSDNRFLAIFGVANLNTLVSENSSYSKDRTHDDATHNDATHGDATHGDATALQLT